MGEVRLKRVSRLRSVTQKGDDTIIGGHSDDQTLLLSLGAQIPGGRDETLKLRK